MTIHVTTDPREPTLVMERTFDAPRELVWLVLTQPDHVKHWYGGRGFSNPVCEMDVRPGGLWRHVMRTPEGLDFEMNFVFIEVVKPERLVWQQVDHDEPVQQHNHPSSVMTVTLEDAGTQTKWRLVSRFKSLAERARAQQIGFAEVLGEGTDKVNEIAKSLYTASAHARSA
jgi:uncharacterized protein YndB with AHSA1/START domain